MRFRQKQPRYRSKSEFRPLKMSGGVVGLPPCDLCGHYHDEPCEAESRKILDKAAKKGGG